MSRIRASQLTLNKVNSPRIGLKFSIRSLKAVIKILLDLIHGGE